MNLRFIMPSLFTLYTFSLFSFSINSRPLSIIPTSDSILEHKERYKPCLVGSRKRYGTATGVSWFHGNYLAILNLYGEKIVTYHFDKAKNEFTPLQHIKNSEPRLQFPEQLTVSPNGRFLAVCNPGASNIQFYAIDLTTHLINPSPIFLLPTGGFTHNVRFSPDGAYFAYASFNNDESISLYNVIEDGETFNLKQTYRVQNNIKLLKTKTVNFTRDGRYIIAAYALSLSTTIHNPFENRIVVRQFNADGTIGKIVSRVAGHFCTEDIALLNNDRVIVASDQSQDQLILYPFDPKTGQVDARYTTIHNPEAQLSFPHGLAISPDQNYLAVTNYGTDACNVYQVYN